MDLSDTDTSPEATSTHGWARRAVKAAQSAAETAGRQVSVAIVDREGHDLLVVRGPGAPWFTPGVARAKARTCAVLRIPSAGLSGLNAHPGLLDQIDDQLPFRLTQLPGGLPITVHGETVGAIGVSGADPDDDVAYAQAGVNANAEP